MEYFGKTVCATYDELTSGNDPVIKPGTLKSLQYRKRVDVISRGGGGGNIALYVYSSIPERYRIRFEQKYGDPVELMSMKLKFYFILIISVTISIHAFASLNRVKSSKYIEIKKYEVVDIVFKSTKSSCPFDVEFSVLFTSRNRIILFKVLNYSTLISLEKSPNH